jgi:HEAT repeat protein
LFQWIPYAFQMGYSATVCFLLVLLPSVLPAVDPPSDRAWKLLTAGLADKSATTRAEAVHAIGLLPNVPRAQTLAENALNDPDRNVRAEAAGSLGRMNAMSARPRLRQALQDKDVKVVIASANALYQLKDPAAYQVYYALLTGSQKSSSGLVKSELDMLHDRKQLEKLAFEAGIGFMPYGGIGYEAWKTVTRDDASPIRAAAARGLATDPDPKSGAALAQFASDKKWQVRAGVVEAIANRGDPALLDPVLSLLDDGNGTVRYNAAAAVVRLTSAKHPPVKGLRPRPIPLAK